MDLKYGIKKLIIHDFFSIAVLSMSYDTKEYAFIFRWFLSMATWLKLSSTFHPFPHIINFM